MPDVLIFADTVRSPELRHEVPLAIPDPLVYVERDGERHVFVSSFEIPRLEAAGRYELVPLERLGLDDLLRLELLEHELDRELVLRACRLLDVREAVTPASFPVDVADHLRASGVAVSTDGTLFEFRRRAKTGPELEGIRRAQRAAERAMEAVRRRLGSGGSVTCEELRLEATRAFTEAGVTVPDLVIVSHGLRRLPSGGPRPRHRRRLRGPDGLPVRPRPVARALRRTARGGARTAPRRRTARSGRGSAARRG